MSDIESICDYWFGSNPDDVAVAKEKGNLWWSKNPAVDSEIRERFGNLVEAAGRNELSDLAATPRGLLALILLTDQFPRNICRASPRAFASDPLARAHCRDGIARGLDRELRPIERVFHYLPLEHSESLDDQNESVRLFSGLVRDAAPQSRELFEGYHRYAEQHSDIIVRFGRFPHRNRILGRVTTPEEDAFLKGPGSSF